MAKKLSRQQAMLEILDALNPTGSLTYDDAAKLAAICEAVAALYEKGGTLRSEALGLAVKPAAMKADFWAAVQTPAIQDA